MYLANLNLQGLRAPPSCLTPSPYPCSCCCCCKGRGPPSWSQGQERERGKKKKGGQGSVSVGAGGSTVGTAGTAGTFDTVRGHVHGGACTPSCTGHVPWPGTLNMGAFSKKSGTGTLQSIRAAMSQSFFKVGSHQSIGRAFPPTWFRKESKEIREGEKMRVAKSRKPAYCA